MNKREKDKKNQRNERQKLLGGIKGNIGNENNNIDLVMASNTQVTWDHNINNYELCVDSNDTSKKGEFKNPTLTLKIT